MNTPTPHAAATYTWPDEHPSHTLAYLAPTITQWLRDAGARRVLDLGCGNGAMTRHLASEGFEMTGLDASDSGIAVARRHAPHIPFVHAWMQDPLPPALLGAFDAVVSAEVIEHLLLPRELCARAREALRPGGRLVVTTPYHGYLKNLALALAGKFDDHWHPDRDGGHVKFFSRATLSALLFEQGFAPARFARAGRIPALAKSMVVEARLNPQPAVQER